MTAVARGSIITTVFLNKKLWEEIFVKTPTEAEIRSHLKTYSISTKEEFLQKIKDVVATIQKGEEKTLILIVPSNPKCKIFVQIKSADKNELLSKVKEVWIYANNDLQGIPSTVCVPNRSVNGLDYSYTLSMPPNTLDQAMLEEALKKEMPKRNKKEPSCSIM